MNKPVTLAIIGAGKRGEAYADYALKHPDLARVVAVAEPRKVLRERMAKQYNIPKDRCFKGWKEFAAQPRMADAALICTQDRMHRLPVEAIAPRGYAILLEKPMSPRLKDCEAIIACVKKHGNLFAVCHVLLYTEITMKLRELIRGGAIGDVVSIQHLEPVAWWHQAHSFVRGNWGIERESSPMLLAKSCHDMDWIRHIVGSRCTRVSSFGSLRHFKPSERPVGAADRCMHCPSAIESTCPYSAKRIYLTNFGRDWITDYLNDVITGGHGTRDNVEKALRDGNYGRCVYACGNDVVDNQTVMLEYEGPVTVNFTMTAFTPTFHRQTRIFGTHGYIESDFVRIKVFNFVTEQETVHDTSLKDGAEGATAAGGHGGGDYHIMQAFVNAVATGDASSLHSGPDATLESHRIVFAAEKSRRTGKTIKMANG
jgi:predicted dehydrogenase